MLFIIMFPFMSVIIMSTCCKRSIKAEYFRPNQYDYCLQPTYPVSCLSGYWRIRCLLFQLHGSGRCSTFPHIPNWFAFYQPAASIRYRACGRRLLRSGLFVVLLRWNTGFYFPFSVFPEPVATGGYFHRPRRTRIASRLLGYQHGRGPFDVE